MFNLLQYQHEIDEIWYYNYIPFIKIKPVSCETNWHLKLHIKLSIMQFSYRCVCVMLYFWYGNIVNITWQFHTLKMSTFEMFYHVNPVPKVALRTWPPTLRLVLILSSTGNFDGFLYYPQQHRLEYLFRFHRNTNSPRLLFLFLAL